jgi:hypothetical protein
MADQPEGCARITGAVLGASEPAPGSQAAAEPVGKEAAMTARVGGKAPDFSAPAYFRGSFTNVQLSSYLGKWILLCFYPGDFTFV